VEADFVNLISYRVTATELVLEFGNFFPGQEGRAEADEANTVWPTFTPHCRQPQSVATAVDSCPVPPPKNSNRKNRDSP
jgi:hypothetical protein